MMNLNPYGWVAVWEKMEECPLCDGQGIPPNSIDACKPCKGTGRTWEKKAFNIDNPDLADETEPDGEGWILDEVYPAEAEDTTAADDAYEQAGDR